MSSDSSQDYEPNYNDSDDQSLNFDSAPDSSVSGASTPSLPSAQSTASSISSISSISAASSSSSDSAHSSLQATHMSPHGSGTSRGSSTASSLSGMQMEHDDSTEDYDLPQVNGDVIDLSSTQFMTQAPVGLGNGEDDDDVILIPQHVETIDLCSESVYEIPRRPVPLFVREEVIEIQDSPAEARRGPRVMIPHRRADDVARTSPVIRPAPRQPARTSPYQAAAAARKTPPKPRQLNLDDSMNDNDEPTQRVKITCPICLDSSMKKKMVSTKCGHIHCEECLKSSLQAAKKCPVCRKALTGKDPFHPIYFGGHQ